MAVAPAISMWATQIELLALDLPIPSCCKLLVMWVGVQRGITDEIFLFPSVSFIWSFFGASWPLKY